LFLAIINDFTAKSKGKLHSRPCGDLLFVILSDPEGTEGESKNPFSFAATGGAMHCIAGCGSFDSVAFRHFAQDDMRFFGGEHRP